MNPMIMVYTTFSSKEKAVEVADKLLEEKLIGCYNLFQISSGYWWKGKIEHSPEWGLLMKTKLSAYKRLQKRLKELHEYEVPVIAGWFVPLINEEYYSWLNEVVKE